MRVALVPRSAKIKPLFWRFVHSTLQTKLYPFLLRMHPCLSFPNTGSLSLIRDSDTDNYFPIQINFDDSISY